MLLIIIIVSVCLSPHPGFTIWHSFVDILAIYLVLSLCGGSLLSLALTWLITMVTLTKICPHSPVYIV